MLKGVIIYNKEIWQSYYEILGINKTASKDDIKKAFGIWRTNFTQIKRWRREKFKEANEAYSVLSDDRKRSEYDSYGRVFSAEVLNWFGASGFRRLRFSNFTGEGFGNANFDFGDINLGDMFSDFGRSTGERHRQRGLIFPLIWKFF